MTIQKINYGLAPDDGTGDKLRDAFRKTDDNFTDLDTRKANAQDVVDALAFKADTATVDSQLAFKADVTYVDTELAKKANLASPALTGTPTAPTAAPATNTDQVATAAFVQAVTATKVDKVAGKQLSTEDYTSAEKTKLSGIADGATANNTDTYLLDRANHTGTQAPDTIAGLTQWQANPTGVQSVNGGQIAGFRNKIINGSFRVWQRGAGIPISGSDTYTADRWFAVAAGENLAAFRLDYNAGNASALVISGAASNTLCDIGQRIEGVNTEDLAGKVVTLSCEVYREDTGIVTWEARYANSVDNFTTTTLISSGTIAVTGGTFKFAAVNFTVPLAFAHHGIEIRFKYGALTETKQAGIRRVQLEVGEVVTPFEHRPYGVELFLCQRYYERGFKHSIGNVTGVTTDVHITIWFAVRKRASPTASVIPGSDLANSVAETGVTYRSPTGFSFFITPDSMVANTLGVTYTAAFRPIMLASDVLEVSAEL